MGLAAVVAILLPAASMEAQAQLVSLASQSLAEDSSGFLWLGTQDGLNRWDSYQLTSFHHDAANSTSLPDSWISAL